MVEIKKYDVAYYAELRILAVIRTTPSSACEMRTMPS